MRTRIATLRDIDPDIKEAVAAQVHAYVGTMTRGGFDPIEILDAIQEAVTEARDAVEEAERRIWN